MRSDASDQQHFVVTGVILEEETGRPLPNLIVRAFDRDLFFDDKVGFSGTDEHGRFEIGFRVDDFREFRETRPDLYLRIYDSSGIRLIHETTDAIRWKASPRERYEIRIPARALNPSRPSAT